MLVNQCIFYEVRFQDLAPNVSVLAQFGSGHAAPSVVDPLIASALALGNAGPLCRAPQMVEGTTFITARPGRANELATLLESHPMSVRGRAAQRKNDENLEQ